MKKNAILLLLLSSALLSETAAQNTSPYWSLAGNSNASAANSKLGTTNSIPLRFFTNNQPRAYISPGGNFGIGTTTPQQRFHVEAPTLLSIFVSTSPLSNISGSGMIGYTKFLPTASGQRLGYFLLGSRGGAENNYNAAGMVGYAGGSWTAGSSHPAYLAFETTPSGSASRVERLRITPSGDVGIGTNLPSNKLHVIGRGRFSDGLSVEDGGIYSSYSSGNGLEAYGNTSSGIGTYGSGYYGAYGSGTYGVYGSGSSYGVYGNSTNYGVFGSATNYGVWGNGNGTSSYGVVAYGGSTGAYGSGGSYGVYGVSSTETGVYGYTGGNGTNYYGVYGYNNSIGYGVRGYCSQGAGVYGSSGSGFAGYFAGNVYATGTYQGSDSKLKKNVEEMTDALAIINKLQPKSYEFRQDGNYKLMHLPTGKRYGLIAQEVEAVLPNLVKTANFEPRDEEGVKPLDPKNLTAGKAAQKSETIEFKAVNYVELIPILIKGMQQQQQLIEQQQTQIDELKSLVSKLTGDQSLSTVGSGSLSQSSPNPASGTARIAYNVPSGARSARLLLTDNLGRTIRTMTLAGSGTVDIETASLSSGVYNYSLIIDGKTIQTKKMAVVR